MVADEDEVAVLHGRPVHRHHAAAAPKDAGLELIAVFLDAQPTSPAAGNGQSPTAHVRVGIVRRRGELERAAESERQREITLHSFVQSRFCHVLFRRDQRQAPSRKITSNAPCRYRLR